MIEIDIIIIDNNYNGLYKLRLHQYYNTICIAGTLARFL